MTFLATFDNISTLSGVIDSDDGDAQIAQLVEQWTENPCVAGSIPALGIENKICDSGSVGGVQPCQGWGRGFESRFSLYFFCLKRRVMSGWWNW